METYYYFLKIYLICIGALLTCMAMNIFSHASCPRRSEEYTGCTKIEGTECEELPCWCWESSPGLLEEQPVLLTNRWAISSASENRFPCLLFINNNIRRWMLCRNYNLINLRIGGNTVILLFEKISIMYLFYSIGFPPL